LAYACPQPSTGVTQCNLGNGDESALRERTNDLGGVILSGLSRRSGPWLYAFNDLGYETMYVLLEGSLLGVPYLAPVPPDGMIPRVFSILGAPPGAAFVGASIRDCNGSYAPGVIFRGTGEAGAAQVLYADQTAPLAGLNPSATQTDKSGAAATVVVGKGAMTYTAYHAATGRAIASRPLNIGANGRFFIHFIAEPKPRTN
jgi:hypothetical protein